MRRKELELESGQEVEYKYRDTEILGKGTSGVKFDQGKVQMSLLLLFDKAIPAIAELATGGARKYPRGGFLHIEDGINRYTDAMLRHLFGEMAGEYTNDMEPYLGKEVLHATAVAWNAMARLQFILQEKVDNGTE